MKEEASNSVYTFLQHWNIYIYIMIRFGLCLWAACYKVNCCYFLQSLYPADMIVPLEVKSRHD